MQCPKCKADNPEGARFCMNCAEPLVLVCAQCGTELPPAAKFCFNCAAPVAQPASTEEAQTDTLPQYIQRLIPKQYAQRLLATRGQPHDERRTVTILFSDVKGSTAMAEKLDPEEVKEIMDGAFEFLSARRLHMRTTPNAPCVPHWTSSPEQSATPPSWSRNGGSKASTCG